MDGLKIVLLRHRRAPPVGFRLHTVLEHAHEFIMAESRAMRVVVVGGVTESQGETFESRERVHDLDCGDDLMGGHTCPNVANCASKCVELYMPVNHPPKR